MFRRMFNEGEQQIARRPQPKRTAEETSAAQAKQLEKATSCLVPGSSTELADRYKKPNKTKLEPLKGIRGSSPLRHEIPPGDLHLYKFQTGVW